MRLDFNILWVEDQPERVKAQRERIERSMRNEGFKLQTEFANSVEDAKNHLDDDIFRDHVDLVLMDFELAGEANGGEGLEVVRDLCQFKDIVFYSANTTANLKSIVSEKDISGVFCTSRSGLPDTVVGVFEMLVKKVLDIDHSRGIVMGATSEIDDFVNQALEVYLEKSDPDTATTALTIAQKDIKKIRAKFEEELSQMEAVGNAVELKSYHQFYTSAKRLILLRKLLKQLKHNNVDLNAMLAYEQKTVPKRNILAHVTVERNGFARKIIDKNGTELTVEYMRTLRVDLLDHHQMFEKLLQTIRNL